MAHVINNHHNNHDYDDDNNQQTATTKTALTKANISINNSVNNANNFVLDNDNNRLYRQSSSDDLSYEKHYNEETFIEFDDNEEGGSDHSSPTSTPSILDLNKLTTSYHIRQADDALGRLKTVAEPLGWKKLLTHKSGVVVYGKPGVTKDDKIPVFMGEHIIKGFAPQSIFAVIGTRKLWDDWYEEGSLVENLNETTSLTYMVIQALAGSKARDLSLVEKIECTLEGKIYFVSTSVYTPKVPHISNRIRAHIHLNGWILEPLSYNPPVTKVNYVLQTSVKGWIPPLVAKKYLSRRPLVIHTIEAYLQKNGPPTMFIKTADDYSPTTSQISSYAASTLSFTKNNDNNDNTNTNISFTRYDDSEKSEQSIGHHNSTDSFSNLTNIINNITIDNNSSKNGNNNYNDDDDTDVKGYDGNTSATDSPSPVPIVNGINRNGTRKIKFFDESGLRLKSSSSETTPGTVVTHNYRSVIDTFKSLPSLPPNPTELTSSPSSPPPITEKSITNVKNIITTTPTTNVSSNAIVTPTTISTTSTPTTPQTPITTLLEKINIKIPEKNRTTHRHSESLNVAIDNFETEAMSFDGWSFHSDSKGVKIYTKDVEGKSTPIMRGESRISGGFTVEDVLSIISSIEMRKIWDERFEDGIMLEKLNHSDVLVKSMLKGSFPVSGRDLSVVSTTKYDLDTGIVGFITTSVIDPLIPETRKHVRARLSFAGFKLIPEFDDNGFTKHVDVKYIVDIDIKLDTIPSSILKQVSIQTPMTLIKIDELLQKSGFPPYIRESTSQTSMKSRAINTKTFECDIEVTNVFLGAVTELKVSRKMYPGGYELTIQPENAKVELLPNKVEVVRIVTLSGVNDVDDNTSVMKIKIKRNTSKGVKVTYNGGKAIPLASLSPSSENTTEVPTSPKPGSNDQNRRPVTTPEYINQNDTSNSIKKTLPIIEPSRSILSPSIPLPPKFVSQIPVINSNGDDDDNNTNVITANHHQETSASTLVEPLVEKNNDNDENKEKSITEEQIFKHLTKTTTTVDGEGEDSQTVSINNLNNHFASFTESFRFNTQQVGLMFASMLLAYYAGKLSG